MHVLVLGANGYTASSLIRELLKEGHQVRGLVRDLDRGAALEAQGMEVRVGTLSDVESIRTIAEDIEIIINLIGYCRAETSVVRSVLVEGMRNLLQVIDRARLQKFVFASNVAVYGHPKFEARLDEM